jgi:hypothetical protein
MSNAMEQQASVISDNVNDALKRHVETLEGWDYAAIANLLYGWADRFNREFNLRIETPAIRIARLPKSLGLYRAGHNPLGLRHEITVSAKHLKRPLAETLDALLYELLHEWPWTRRATRWAWFQDRSPRCSTVTVWTLPSSRRQSRNPQPAPGSPECGRGRAGARSSAPAQPYAYVVSAVAEHSDPASRNAGARMEERGIMTNQDAAGVALLIDWENIKYGLRNDLGITPSPRALRKFARRYGRLEVARAYADWKEHGADQEVLFREGIAPVFALARRTEGESPKNSVDVLLAVECCQLALNNPSIGTIAIVVGDFAYLHPEPCMRKLLITKWISCGRGS